MPGFLVIFDRFVIAGLLVIFDRFIIAGFIFVITGKFVTAGISQTLLPGCACRIMLPRVTRLCVYFTKK